jgi:hypothetical protein
VAKINDTRAALSSAYVGTSLDDDVYLHGYCEAGKQVYFRAHVKENAAAAAAALKIDVEVLDGRVELYVSQHDMYCSKSRLFFILFFSFCLSLLGVFSQIHDRCGDFGWTCRAICVAT